MPPRSLGELVPNPSSGVGSGRRQAWISDREGDDGQSLVPHAELGTLERRLARVHNPGRDALAQRIEHVPVGHVIK